MYSAVVLALLAFVATAQAKCDKNCDIPVKHYEEVGCEPVYAKPDDCCPTSYNCAKFADRPADKCQLNGKEYNFGDKIDNTEGSCLTSCYCAKQASLIIPEKDINCAHIDCPEFFGRPPLGPGCFRVYDGHCCARQTICPPIDKNIATCKVGDKTYYEGQKFQGPDECINCICKLGFEGKFVEPFCRPVNCGVELIYSKKFRDNCAPTYYGKRKCCPTQWQCLSDKDTIIPAEKPSAIKEKCKYGNKELSIGDKVIPERYSIHSPEINCECRIPPLLTCIQKPYEEKEPMLPTSSKL